VLSGAVVPGVAGRASPRHLVLRRGGAGETFRVAPGVPGRRSPGARAAGRRPGCGLPVRPGSRTPGRRGRAVIPLRRWRTLLALVHALQMQVHPGSLAAARGRDRGLHAQAEPAALRAGAGIGQPSGGMGERLAGCSVLRWSYPQDRGARPARTWRRRSPAPLPATASDARSFDERARSSGMCRWSADAELSALPARMLMRIPAG
jgi:hypothetical protein